MAISESDRDDAYRPRIQGLPVNVDGIVAMLRRQAAFIAVVTLVCSGICLGLISLSAPKYVASGRILFELPVTQAGGRHEPPAAAGASDVGDQIRVMTSRTVYDRVIAREKLEADPLFGGQSRGILSALLAGLGLYGATDPHAMALRRLERAVSVVHDPGSRAVDINVVTSNRDVSIRIANAIMDEYAGEQASTRGEAPPGTSESSASRLETLRARLRNAEQRYEAFRSQNQRSSADSRSSTDKQTSDLSAQISAMEIKISTLRSRLGKIERARRTLDGGGIPDMARSGAFGGAGERYAAVKQFELDLSETLGPRHPDLVIARLRAADAKRLLDQSIQGGVQSVSAELEQARASLIQLKNRLEVSRQDVTVSSESASRLRELETDVEASRAAYQAVLARSRDPAAQARSDVLNARIVSRATAPLESRGAFPFGVLLASLLIGLGLGVSLAWMRELMDEPAPPVIVP